MSQGPSSQLRLSLFGPPQIARADGTAITFRSRKHLALLVYLALEQRHSASRDTLLALLWPEAEEQAARNNLRVALADLRRALGEGPFLQTTRHSVQFDPASDHTLDVLVFRKLLDASQAHSHEAPEQCAACLARLEQAVGVYRGDFLQGFSLSDSSDFEEWALVVREQTHQAALEALGTLTAAYERQGKHAAQCRTARRQIELEPWREQAHAELMRGLWASGQRGAALEQYHTCQRILEAELGLSPSPELTALYEQIRRGELSTEYETEFVGSRTLLPTPLTPFVGREADLNELASLWQRPVVRLLTLVGAGGMGKTRLALEAARAQIEHFSDGAIFVSLAPLTSAADIAPAIANTIGLELRGEPRQALFRYLRDKHLLLILDNFEHLLDGVGLVVEILEAAPQVQVLATSREQLNVRGEHLHVVEAMDYAPNATLAEAATSSAVQLFVQSARRVQPRFKLIDANLSAVLRICQLVGGMPLGLELAAAWVETLALDETAQEIERSADFLATEWRDAPERQRSMRAVFDWSWQLLSDAERQVFSRISVFRGGFTREAAQVVAGAPLRVLRCLMHKSLLRWGQFNRYEVHELLRQFAAEQLDSSTDERAAVEARHGEFYLQFVAQREQRLGRNEPREAAAEIQTEIDNIRQAWDWAVGQTRTIELAQAAYGWWQFCQLTGRDSEIRHMFGQAVARLHSGLGHASIDAPSGRQHQRGLSILLAIHAFHLFSHVPYEQMAAEAREAMRLGAASEGLEGETLGHFVLGRALQELGQQREARAMWERTIELARAYRQLDPESELLYDAEWLANIWLFGSSLFFEDYAGGRVCVVQSLQISQSLQKRRAELISLSSLAMIDFYMGDDLSARQRYEQVLALARALDDSWHEMRVQRDLSEVLWSQGEYAQADRLLSSVVQAAHEFGILYDEIWALGALVHLHCQLGDMDNATRWRERLVQCMDGRGVAGDCLAQGLRACAIYALYSGDNQQALAHAERAWQISEQFDILTFRADSAIILGHARARMGQPDLAAASYQQAVAWYNKIGNVAMTSEPQAGLAQLALARDDRAQAQMLVEIMLPVLSERPRARVLTPFYAYLICYRVLEALHDPRAADLLQAAHALLMEYANHIRDEALRRSFLENVPTHHELKQAFGQTHQQSV